MPKLRNTQSLAPLTPASSATNIHHPVTPRRPAEFPELSNHIPAPASELKFLREMLASERRRHAATEKILVRANEALERNLVDLRLLVIQRTARDLNVGQQ
jgi:hypothetical protein